MEPGWYPDPWGGRAFRWWDGSIWTPSLAATDDAPVPTDPRPVVGDEPVTLAPPALQWAIWTYVGSFLAAGIAFAIAFAIFGDRPIVDVAGAVGLYGPLVLTSRRISRRRSGDLRADLGFAVSRHDIGPGALTFLTAVVFGTMLVSFLGESDRFHGTNTDDLFPSHALLSRLAVICIAVIAAPLVEELFFRGLLLRALARRVGWAWANVGQAALFTLAHTDPTAGLHNTEVLIRIGVLGLVFGYTATRTRRLGPGIVAHAITNTLAVVVALAT